jgi:pimeloyl-ACP methyl ester carboxylesterase
MASLFSQSFQLQRDDGSMIEGYLTPPDSASKPVIIAIQGSSSQSVYPWHLDLSERAEAQGLGLLTIERRGYDDAEVFRENDALDSRLSDYHEVINHLSELLDSSWQGGVILLAHSEGGLIALNLAPSISDLSALLLFSTGGGLTAAEETLVVLESRLSSSCAFSQDETLFYLTGVKKLFEEMCNDPTISKEFLGKTYRWWSSLLSIKPSDIAAISCPIYMLHGTLDQRIPVISADTLADQLAYKNFSYFRLNTGHELTPYNVDHAFEWIHVALNTQPHISPLRALPDWDMIFLDYVIERGNGNLSLNVQGSTDDDGNKTVSGGASISKSTDDGITFKGGLEGSISHDSSGHTTTSGSVTGSINIPL